MKSLKAVVNKDIQTPSGMLYKDTKVTLKEEDIELPTGSKVKVIDMAGKIYYVKRDFISPVNLIK